MGKNYLLISGAMPFLTIFVGGMKKILVYFQSLDENLNIFAELKRMT